jgi:hypothetical protein
MTRATTPLGMLRGAVRDVARAEAQLHEAVGLLREAGWTWKEIAAELGVSPQAAHERFTRPGVPRRVGRRRSRGGA